VTSAWQLVEAYRKFRSLKPLVLVGCLDGGFWLNGKTPGIAPGQLASDFGTFAFQLNLLDESVGAGGANPNKCSDGYTCPWHGNAVASVACAAVGNGHGIAGVGGTVARPVMFKSELSISQIFRCLQVCLAWGVDVLNMSFSKTSWELVFPTTSWNRSFQFAADNGLILVAAAGNETLNLPDDDNVRPATRTPGTITVRALNASDSAASYSNFGSAIDIWAPGDNLPTAPDPANPDGSAQSGTSMAAPFVSGVIAMMRAVKPSLNTFEAKQLLANSGWRGTGRVNTGVDAFAAVLAAMGGQLPEDLAEQNNTPQTAAPLYPYGVSGALVPLGQLGENDLGALSRRNDMDWYRLRVDEFSTVTLDLSFFPLLGTVRATIVPDDSDSRVEADMASSFSPGTTRLTGPVSAGGYKVRIDGSMNAYKLTVKLSPAVLEADDFETDNSFDQATHFHLRTPGSPAPRFPELFTNGPGRCAAYTLDQLADDARALLKALGIARTHWVGLSMGGMIGQTLALKAPGVFASLSLCDTSSRIPVEVRPLWQDRIKTAETQGMEPLVQPTLERWFTEPFRTSRKDVVDKVAKMIRSTPAAGYAGCVVGVEGVDHPVQELPDLGLGLVTFGGLAHAAMLAGGAREVILTQVRGSAVLHPLSRFPGLFLGARQSRREFAECGSCYGSGTTQARSGPEVTLVNPLIQRLLDLMQSLRPAAGAPSSALSDLLQAEATASIQQDASQAYIPASDLDPMVADAIRAGAEQAAALTLAGKRLRIATEDLPLNTVAARAGELRSATFGPFVERTGRLVRYAAFESGAFLSVRARLGILPIGEAMLLIPAASQPDAKDARSWNVAAGTVWIASRFLVVGATGFTGLRIAGGTLQFRSAAARIGTVILLPPGAGWSLSVQPEPPPAPGPAGVDAEGLSLGLPSRLEVHMNGPAVATGGARVSGFGSDLNLTLSGSAFIDGSQISFPMTAAETDWTITGNRSNLAQFSGTSTVASPRWALPMSSTPAAMLGEAAYGGSIVLRLPTGITSMLAGQQGGPSRWFAATLTLNAQRIELDAAQAASDARYDELDLWTTSQSSFHFSRRPIGRLLFRSERGGAETAVIVGGTVNNKWDLPRRADGPPFPFDGTSAIFGIFSNPAGSWLTATATATVADQSFGLALENLYVLVQAPRRLFVVASFDQAPLVASGIALLFFDVSFALPTLPDPYAANLGLPDVRGAAEQALRVVLTWVDGAEARLAAHLDKPVRFSEPRFAEDPDQDEQALYTAFRNYLGSEPEFLYLMDMSSREHLFGVAIESPSDRFPQLVDNRLAFEARRLRLLMQPQVQWEPVQAEPSPGVPTLVREILHSTMNGGPTLVGASNVTLVPALPEPVTEAILGAIKLDERAAALFSLPFGLRAMARLSPSERVFAGMTPPGAITELHEPGFGDLSSARQIRITARNTFPPPAVDPSRYIPGMLRQLKNLRANASKLSSVTPDDLLPGIQTQFGRQIPLQHADLSGYGLSSFSQWIMSSDNPGFSKVEFQVLNGRTAYEVLQYRSALYECGARVVRTVILERHNSGRVYRSDSGWVAVEPGLFTRPKQFEKGACLSFQNIRRIRIVGDVITVDGASAVEPVIFDADAEIEGHPGLVPIDDRPGYVQVPPPPPAVAANPMPYLTEPQVKALFDKVGPIGSPIDCATRIGGTLDTQLSSIVSDAAPDDGGGVGFAIAVVGTPALPHAGQWNVMRIDASTREVSPVDSRRGVPIVRVGGQPFRFREPSDARRTPHIEHGLLMATESSRVLFPQPSIDPGAAGQMRFDIPPVMADPYSLVQSTAQFPRPAFGLVFKETALFHIGADNLWRIDNPNFTVPNQPQGDLLKGGDWGINRSYDLAKNVQLLVDSGMPAPFDIGTPTADLNLVLPAGLDDILKIRTNYTTVAGGLPKLAKPDLLFAGALEDLKDILDSLKSFSGLGFDFDVSVTSGGGSSPSFVVHLQLVFRIGTPLERIDIGVGKFYGQFTVQGDLEAAVAGTGRALLLLDFRGDLQQGIIPPLLYAGGLFRFRIELHDTGSPVIQLSLGVVASIGGDLIPGLLEVEVTVMYGYTLIPETLEPGVLLGLDARAKLLGGLVGFSFGVEAMARIKRPAGSDHVTVFAQIRVAGSVQIAIFIEEDVDFETQFQQDIPLALVAAAAFASGLGPAGAAL
jgi:pimeloyl-ACP methyl ester carboxylesterase